MRAVVFRSAGPPSVLELHADWPEPTLAYGQIKVKVFATSVNPIDHKVRAGAYFPYLLKTPHVCLTRCSLTREHTIVFTRTRIVQRFWCGTPSSC